MVWDMDSKFRRMRSFRKDNRGGSRRNSTRRHSDNIDFWLSAKFLQGLHPLELLEQSGEVN